MFTLALPVLVTVTDCVAALPDFTLPKLKLDALDDSATVELVPLPLSAMDAELLAALLSIVMDPDSVAALVGLNCAVNVALLPAPSVYGVDIPDAVMPDPETLIFEIVMVADPEFASLMVCVASLPTVTFPKLTDEGVIESAEAFPDPVQSAVSLELLVVTVSAPESVVAELGLNVAVTLALWPAAIVAGSVSPESVTPLPEMLTFEIVAALLPEFVIFTVSVAVVPSDTLPKLIESGERASELETPCPFRGIVVGESSALLVIVTAPVDAPFSDALNDTLTCPVCPAANVAGAASPPTVNPEPETEIFEMLSDSVPSFVTVTGCIEPVPTAMFPKLSDAGETDIAIVPAPLPPPTAPLPVVPTQPEVMNVAANVTRVSA
jgi:hypothetical protein